MPLCYFSSVSHYTRNAVFNMVFVENVQRDFNLKKKDKRKNKNKNKKKKDLNTNCGGTTQDYRSN